jgi:predicted Zn-dependent peptidase
MHRISVLNSGLRVITCEMPHMESVAVGVWVGVGGRYEKKAHNGISHFLEHMLFKGTRRRSAKQISQAIENVGGSVNGFTGEEYTCYMIKVLHRHLLLGLDVLLDMYLHPAIREQDVEKEKRVVREEINMYLDTPQHLVIDLFNKALWSDHPLGRPLIGTHETIATFEADELKNYQKRNYNLANTVIAVSGRVRHEEVVRLLNELLPRSGVSYIPRYLAAKIERGRSRLIVHRKATEQTHLCVGTEGYKRDHPDRYALHLLSIALGENMSSRLFQQIREKHGLAYAIHSTVIRYRDTGAFAVYAGVEHKKFIKALVMILREMKKIREKMLKKAELARAREYCISQLAMGLEKTTQSMARLGENLLCSGRVLTKEQILSNLRKVHLEDIQRVACDLFDDRKLKLAVVGPLPEKEETINAHVRF